MNKSNNIFKDILYIFPVMGYYAFEAIIVGIFITFIWKLLLSQFLGNIDYLPIVGIYWIIKMLLFDVFKLMAGLSSLGNNMEKETEYDPDNENYNENITP